MKDFNNSKNLGMLKTTLKKQSESLPTLYKSDVRKPDTFYMWKVSAIGKKLHTLHGKEFSKKQTSTEKRVHAPKTSKMSDKEFALVMAKRAWLKKLDNGYSPKGKDLSDEYKALLESKNKSGGNNHCLLEGKQRKRPVNNADTFTTAYKPNCAHIYTFEAKTRKYFDYKSGVYLQPKLDGQRCLAFLENDKVFLLSRKSKQWKWLDHIREDVRVMLQGKKGLILDGELYVHTIDDIEGDIERFGFISSCCKTSRTSPHQREQLLEFHVFDVIVPDKPEMLQKGRMEILNSLFENYEGKFIKKVETIEIFSEKVMNEIFAEMIEKGYEGIMLRDKNLVYNQGKREQRLRKFKEFYDNDFLIVGANQAEGNQKGCVVWMCETEKGEQFTTTMKGSLEFRREMYENKEEYMGKYLKVRHQTPLEEIEKGVIPRFPVGLGVRED